MSNKRINIEFMRIFAILMTIAIHVSNIYLRSFDKISSDYFLTSAIYNAMSRVCVPLFFMISGAFSIKKEYSRKKYFDRILKFILILTVWSIIYYIQKHGFNFKGIGKVLINSLFNAEMTSRHLWYMYAFIGICIALPFIQIMCKNLSEELENLFMILWILLSGLSVIILPIAREITNTNVNIGYPIPIINAAYYLGYFIAGHIIYKRFENRIFSKIQNLCCILIYVISTAITALGTYFISMRKNEFYDSLLWYKGIFTVLATLSIFIIVVVNKDSFKNTVILKFSKHTFGIYLIHVVFLNILRNHFDLIAYNPIIVVPITTLILYLLSLIACTILSKVPYLNKVIF